MPFQYNIQYNTQNAEGIQKAISAELNNWERENKVERLWAGDATLWTNHDESQWLGWLNIPTNELNDVPGIEALTAKIKAEGYEYLILLGMGGSSLCPAMMAETFGQIKDYPLLQILDSTDPLQIHHLEKSVDLKKTFFIVSSKSGTTLEPNIFKQYFYAQLQTILGKKDVGDRFLTITDPGTKLEAIAKEEKFRAVFQGVASIGGRYSALSNFGMVPAGLMGIHIKNFLSYAEKMRQNCYSIHSPQDNPGVLLGIILGVSAKQGKDKVTLVVSPGIRALGAWLEQLLAESTGKLGKGLIPIDQEPLGSPDKYGKDRIFIYIRLEDDPDFEQDKAIAALELSKQMVVRLKLPKKEELGGKLFLFEMATAVAGSVISINPFDQPDVEGSKKLAAKLLAAYKETGKIKTPELLYFGEGIELLTDKKNAEEIKKKLGGQDSPEAYLRAHLNRINLGDYFNISAFIEMSEAHTELLQRARVLIRDSKKVATCVGFGPRFLHSTGQDYKGGPNSGVFLQITADHPNDIQIPDYPYSFGIVIEAQAEADFHVLAERERRVLRVHLGKEVAQGLQQLFELLERALFVGGSNHEPK